jgi:hypothetical protein
MAVTAITGYSCRLVTVGNQNCGNTTLDECEGEGNSGEEGLEGRDLVIEAEVCFQEVKELF